MGEAQQLVWTPTFEVDVWDALRALQWSLQPQGWGQRLGGNVPLEAPVCRGVCTTGARGAPVALPLRRALTDTEHVSCTFCTELGHEWSRFVRQAQGSWAR